MYYIINEGKENTKRKGIKNEKKFFSCKRAENSES